VSNKVVEFSKSCNIIKNRQAFKSCWRSPVDYISAVRAETAAPGNHRRLFLPVDGEVLLEVLAELLLVVVPEQNLKRKENTFKNRSRT